MSNPHGEAGAKHPRLPHRGHPGGGDHTQASPQSNGPFSARHPEWGFTASTSDSPTAWRGWIPPPPFTVEETEAQNTPGACLRWLRAQIQSRPVGHQHWLSFVTLPPGCLSFSLSTAKADQLCPWLSSVPSPRMGGPTPSAQGVT